MGIVFHIAERAAWAAGVAAGEYRPPAFADEGFIHCSASDQVQPVANALFRGRDGLVLLWVDTDRLTSELRWERPEVGTTSTPFPHVYGPIDLAAVIEVEDFPANPDGTFSLPLEARALAVHGHRSLAEIRERAAEVMSGYEGRWWAAGGWAIDLAAGQKTRPHPDLEIAVLHRDLPVLYEHLAGWELRLARPGGDFERWRGEPLPAEIHQAWARLGPGDVPTPGEFVDDPTFVEFLFETADDDLWRYRRHPAVSRPVDDLGFSDASGLPVVRPEIALLYKAKEPRWKDDRDFTVALPLLSDEGRAWLAAAVRRAHPGSPWLNRLAG